ncbi:MAG: hypothetical protein PHQ22_08500 [Sulfuricurvum sp.]|nr:hypothetical protein [Sulfuricurvum sp.]MDD5387217.1 hypothetical protein [Sulfuricurvum sp.]
MAEVPHDIGCNNDECIKKDECKRNEIAKNNQAREIKKFGGTPEKGCGKFLEKK